MALALLFSGHCALELWSEQRGGDAGNDALLFRGTMLASSLYLLALRCAIQHPA